MQLKNLFFSACLVLLFSFSLIATVHASSPVWSQIFGGSEHDAVYDVVETFDEGFALAGYTSSFGVGEADFWLIKTDANGVMQWNKTYGGASSDLAFCLVTADDGGFVLAGQTFSFDVNDFLLVKTDSFGNLQWNKTYSGIGIEAAHCLVKTSDGGYALAGSSGTPSNPAHYPVAEGRTDFYLVKVDSNGNLEWNQTYGGDHNEVAYALVETSDGGFVLGGLTKSFGGDNFWLVKTDSAGNMAWNHTYYGPDKNFAYSVVETFDGGYALASANFWLGKTDANGNLLWNQTYGAEYGNLVYSLVETVDGGFALAGNTNIEGEGQNYWLIKTDNHGNVQWNYTYGQSDYETPYALIQTTDSGFVLAGDTIGSGSQDIWLIKTNEQGIPEFPTWAIIPVFMVVTFSSIIVYRKLAKNSHKNNSEHV